MTYKEAIQKNNPSWDEGDVKRLIELRCPPGKDCGKDSTPIFTKCEGCWNSEMPSNTESDYIIGMSDNEPIKRHERICKELNALYAKKSHDYGDSFHKSYEEWGLPMAAIRLGDKYNRFCRLIKAEAEVKGESIRDTLIDLANYAIMAVMELEQKGKENG